MTMLLITKRLAEAVISSAFVYTGNDGITVCTHCNEEVYITHKGRNCDHKDNCVVIAAKLLLEKEWGIKDGA